MFCSSNWIRCIFCNGHFKIIIIVGKCNLQNNGAAAVIKWIGVECGKCMASVIIIDAVPTMCYCFCCFCWYSCVEQRCQKIKHINGISNSHQWMDAATLDGWAMQSICIAHVPSQWWFPFFFLIFHLKWTQQKLFLKKSTNEKKSSSINSTSEQKIAWLMMNSLLAWIDEI